MAFAAIITALRPILLLFGAVAAMGAASNLIGSITGQNPAAQVSATMLETMMPLMLAIMPMVLVMNMMMGMVNLMFEPLSRSFRAPYMVW